MRAQERITTGGVAIAATPESVTDDGADAPAAEIVAPKKDGASVNQAYWQAVATAAETHEFTVVAVSPIAA